MNQDGPSLIIEASPPLPMTQIAKDLLLCIVFLCCTYVSSVMRPSWHFSTSRFNIRCFPGPLNNYKKVNKFSSDYFHILHVVGGYIYI